MPLVTDEARSVAGVVGQERGEAMSEYTPTTDEVRDYIRAADRVTAHMFSAASPDAVEAFDRWLAAHDAEVRAGVVAEEPEWEYGYRPTYAPMHPEHAGEPMPEIWPTNRTPDDFLPGMGGAYQRTKKRVTPAGPWAPVKQEGTD